MLNDKQSLFLCCFVVLGFIFSGIINILDNFVIIALLSLAFIAVVINLFLQNNQEDKTESED